MRIASPSLLLLTLIVSSACASSTQNAATTTPPPSETREARFARAMEDAEIAEPSEIRDLVVLSADNPVLRTRTREGHTEVLMATMTNGVYYRDSVGHTKRLDHSTVWATAVPEVATFCRALDLEGAPLRERIYEYLGLRPESAHPDFVEFWVDITVVVRPCPDPETSDATCGLGTPSETPFEAGTFRTWFETLAASSYSSTGYPWTRLGYTYDWGAGADERGASEFLVPKGTEVLIEAVHDAASYCTTGSGG